MSLAPIALFAYKRPEHVRRTLESLSRCTLAPQSRLFVYCDGPQSAADSEAVQGVHRVVEGSAWCGEVTVVKRARNRGLARSVIDGVTELCAAEGRVIVLEDDMLLSSGFLEYHNNALRRYAESERVLQISGHVFPFPPVSSAEDAFFMPLSTSQGWSTWARAWALFDPEITGWERLFYEPAVRRRFDLDGAYPYRSMLVDQLQGNVDSWAICWWWSFFVNNGLCLFPRRSLLVNIGFDEQATHTTGGDRSYNDPDWSEGRSVQRLPRLVAVDDESFERLKWYLLRSRNPPLTALLSHLARRLVGGWIGAAPGCL
ncbi:MAG: glycosyltransferase family 2 protein [bacterium]